MSVPRIIGATVGVVMACVAFGNAVPSDTPSVATMAACQEEDGSTPGQEFPCHWDASTQGNGQGKSYDLIYHLCTQAENRAAAAAWLAGHSVPRQCQPEAYDNPVPSDTPSVATDTPSVSTMAACQEEDGSTPGQQFPCHWDASTHGNGQGRSYDIVAP